MGVVGDELLSPSVGSAFGLPRNLRLGQLDERVAALVDPYTTIVLGREVARCAKGRWAEIVGLEVVVSFGGMCALELDLSTRARNHLLRLDPTGNAEARPLRDMTVSELVLIPGFGVECLLDVLSVAKRVPPPSPSAPAVDPSLSASSRELLGAARGLKRVPWSAGVSREDPRLGSMVRAVNRDARSARDAAKRTLECRHRLREERRLLAAIDALTRELDRLRGQRLDEELEGMVGAVIVSPRSRAAALARLGLGGRPSVTLQEAGQTAGVTREAVRQIQQRFHEALAPALEAAGVWAPALDKALQAIRRTGLVTEEQLQTRLARRGLVPEGFPVGSVLTAARVLGKPLDIYVEHGLISGRPVAVTPELIGELATRSVSHWGGPQPSRTCAFYSRKRPPSKHRRGSPRSCWRRTSACAGWIAATAGSGFTQPGKTGC